jgi:hypothetical protein
MRQEFLVVGILGLAIACASDDAPQSSSNALTKPPADASDASDAADETGTTKQLQPTSYTAGNFVDITNLTNTTATMVGGGDASPWIISGTNHSVYHYNNDIGGSTRAWVLEPNSANTTSLAVSPEGIPWRVDNAHHVFFHTGANGGGGWCQANANALAYEVGVGPNYDTWAIGTQNCNGNGDCPIWRWSGSSTCTNGVNSTSWSQPHANDFAQHVAVAADDSSEYVSNSQGTLYKWINGDFQVWPGNACVTHPSTGWQGVPVIGAAANDAVWAIGCQSSNNIWAWHPQIPAYWENVPGTATTISVTADGTPWVVDTTNGLNHNYEYVASWQSIGPHGFSFVDQASIAEIWAGEIHDIDATPAGGAVTIAATAGGVWQTPPTFGWVPIGDTGAGYSIQNNQIAPAKLGPVNSVGTVAVKPTDQNTVIVGTGVAGQLNGPDVDGNGVWVTHNAGDANVTWARAAMFDNAQPPIQILPPPYTFVKIRYSADGTKIYAITPAALFVSTNNAVSFYEASGSSCLPPAGAQLTDLVINPHDANTAYIGVAGWGVYRATYAQSSGQLTCSHGVAPSLFNNKTPDTITQVALAISGAPDPVIYASFAGLPNTPNDNVDDFANLDATTNGTWGTSWSVVVPAFASWGLNSQNLYQPPQYPASYGMAHTWALGTDPSGTLIILAGQGLYRGSGCGPSGCSQFYQLINGATPDTGHADYHAVTWGANGWFYVANDGGVFYSPDGGTTWRNNTNSFGVMNQTAVTVSGSNIFSAAWDNGAQFSTDSGTTWRGDVAVSPTDGRLAFADPSSASHAFVCEANSDNRRLFWDGTSWVEKKPPPLEVADTCVMVKGRYGDLFTTGSLSDQDAVFHSSNYGDTWSTWYTNLISPPWSLVVDNQNPPGVYAISGTQYITVGNNPPISLAGGGTHPWPSGYQFAGANHGSRAGAAAQTDWVTSDFYVVGQDSTYANSRVDKSPFGSYGATWVALTGTTTASTGVPGMLKQDESILTIAVDPSARAVIVGTDGYYQEKTPVTASPMYGAATVWRLNNPGVVDASHHWRPWVDGLPHGTLPVNWLTGQYENGIFYYYAATWGRGIWKREARGGDL